MLLNAENGRLELEGGAMDYIRFGSGERTLVILPGVGDGFRTVKGTALPFALGYRKLAEDFTVYMFSRREPLPEHCSTREMAADLGRALDRLELRRICLMGVSQGGMIAQWAAIDQPRRVAAGWPLPARETTGPSWRITPSAPIRQKPLRGRKGRRP